MSNTSTVSPETTRAIRRVLNQIIRKTGTVNAEVAMISDLLDGAADPAAVVTAAPAGRSNGRGFLAVPSLDGSAADKAAPGTAKSYEVRDIDGEERLLESRDDSAAAPFAVPRCVYDAFAQTTAAHSGKKFDLIFRRHLQQHHDARDYQGRVCFRFWQGKGLLERVRGRYRIVGTPEEFKKRTAEAWEVARSERTR
jgi:hypothetical protein